MKCILRSAAFCLGLVFTAAASQAAIKMASLFCDHMVLQQGVAVPVWGMAAAGDNVTVQFNGQSHAATAGADGKWVVHLDPVSAGGPFEMDVTDNSDKVHIVDILVGEVWLASGQSNMDFTVAKTTKYYFAGTMNEAEEVAAANYPKIRMFSGIWAKAYTPQTQIAGQWKLCNPENVKEFSAIGYFFARDLQKELNVPVGIITETFGASTAQAWVRREALEADPRLKSMLPPFDAAVDQFRKAAATTQPSQPAPQVAVLPPPAAQLAGGQPAGTQPARGQGARGQAARRGGRGRGGPRDPVQDQHQPTVMYNGMIAPVVPYAIKGVIWYQGESITGSHDLFPRINQVLIEDWRKLWGYEFPFYICQLAALKNSSNSPAVRELQAEALKLPNTGMAVTIDVGDPANVHPKNKQAVGDRLMRIALANAYGHKIEYSGPMYDSMQVDGKSIRLKFTHVGGGLVAKGGDLKWFEIAGKDDKFVSAAAKIDGDSIVLSSDAVPDPAAARYAWDPYPEGCNLYNTDGLPAAPFRTNNPLAAKK